jgi:hypothetical protein
LEAILNNPFRVLGLPPTATDKEIAKRVSELLIYAEMGEKVTYETDFEFLGIIDRTSNNIEKSIKKIENPDYKLFYALLSFEINNNIDLNSIRLWGHHEFKESIIILKEEIFKHSPKILSPTKVLVDITKNGFINNLNKENYSIEISRHSHFLNNNIKLGEKYILNHNGKAESPIIIDETKTIVRNYYNFQITCKFKWIDNNRSMSKGIGFVLESTDPLLKNYLHIENSGHYFFDKQKSPWNDVINVSKNAFEKSIINDNNTLFLKKINKRIEVNLNNNLIFSIELDSSIDNIFLGIWGAQQLEINSLIIQELNQIKDLSSEIEVNPYNFSHIKNLMIIKLLRVKQEKYQNVTSFQDAFKLLGNLVTQDYINTYSKKINFIQYRVNFLFLENILTESLYEDYKNIFLKEKNPFHSFGFIQSFSFLSSAAREKIESKILGLEIRQIEFFIAQTINKRKEIPQNSQDLADKLNNHAIEFFNWYDNIIPPAASYNSFEYKFINNKIASELLDCGIDHYNSQEKNNKILSDTIRIIHLSAKFAKSSDIRKRINYNLRVLSKSNPSINITEIDFKKLDWDNYYKIFINKKYSQKILTSQNELKNIYAEINKLVNNFNKSFKTIDSVNDFFQKCNSKLIFQKNNEKNNLEYKKIIDQIITTILTSLSDILSHEEKKLKSEDVHEEIEFIILIDKELKLFELMKNLPMTPIIKERFDRHFDILKTKRQSFENEKPNHKTECQKTRSQNHYAPSTEKFSPLNGKNKKNDSRIFFKNKNILKKIGRLVTLNSWKNNQVLKQVRGGIFVFVVFIGILLILDYSIDKEQKNPAIKQPIESKWKGFQLTNGSAPYSKYFGEQAYDFNSDCWLKFKNSNKADAIVCLENIYSGKTIRNSYIRAGTSYTMENIPTGTYKIKTFYGNDWNPHKTINNGQITGTFERDFYFSTSDKRNDWITLEDDGNIYSTGEITLYNVPDGNMQSRRISSEDFF